MRRFNQEITNRKVIEEIISKAEICRLGFIDNDRAYILPFNYGYKDSCIYIHCAKEGKKIDLIRNSNMVCIEIEQAMKIERFEKACKWSMKYRSVIGYGEARIVTDPEQKKQGLDVIMKHNGANEGTDLDYDNSQVDSLVILKVRIQEITGKQSTNWQDDTM